MRPSRSIRPGGADRRRGSDELQENEDDEQDLRDASEGGRQPAETEDGGSDSQKEEEKCPSKHDWLLCLAPGLGGSGGHQAGSLFPYRPANLFRWNFGAHNAAEKAFALHENDAVERAVGRVLEVDDAAKEIIVSKGYDPAFGARPLKRAIQTLIQNPLAVKLLNGEVREGQTVLITGSDGELVFTPKERAAEAAQ